MATLMREMGSIYQYLIYDLADQRTTGLFLLQSPFPVIALIAGYVYLVKVLGPDLMRSRPAFKLDRVIQVYNVIQIALSLYIVERCLSLGWGGQYNWLCQPMDHSTDPIPMAIVRSSYLYFWIKIIDLMDTVFFVLRKKDEQVTFLHVYHHSGMVAMLWGGVKYMPGGHGTFLGFINSIVHVVMYTYYFLTSIYPEQKKNIWWKKHITQLQMVQFFLLIVHALLLIVQPNCVYPRVYTFILVPQNAFMFALFYDFYRKAYFPRKKKEASSEEKPEKKLTATKPHGS